MRITIDPEQKPVKLRVKSPCIGYCSATTLGDAVCVGCYRDAKDVDMWNRYTETEKTEALIRAYHNYKAIKEEKKA